MRIAQIAPLIESVPPKLYGGTERIVSYLTEELVRQGHDVTLFASGDSVTSATLQSCCPQALRLAPNVKDPIPYYMSMLDKVNRIADQFDIIHFHIDQFHFPLFNRTPTHTLTTLHGRQDMPDLKHLYSSFPSMPLVSISNSQRAPIPRALFAGTVLHGLPAELLLPPARSQGPGYLAFLGRISPEKRVDRAIEIARGSNIPIKIAAKVDRADEEYFQQIRPLLELPGVEFIGEINEFAKQKFLGEALALLFPIDWPEPFGLVMIEAMACGTPVLAFDRGSVREVIDDGITGRIVTTVQEGVLAMPELLALDRTQVRQVFEKRFTAERMARDYVSLYTAAVLRLQPSTLQPGLLHNGFKSSRDPTSRLTDIGEVPVVATDP
jgi:glycosyltransferase involved in cell wall biosynthesis